MQLGGGGRAAFVMDIGMAFWVGLDRSWVLVYSLGSMVNLRLVQRLRPLLIPSRFYSIRAVLYISFPAAEVYIIRQCFCLLGTSGYLLTFLTTR